MTDKGFNPIAAAAADASRYLEDRPEEPIRAAAHRAGVSSGARFPGQDQAGVGRVRAVRFFMDQDLYDRVIAQAGE